MESKDIIWVGGAGVLHIPCHGFVVWYGLILALAKGQPIVVVIEQTNSATEPSTHFVNFSK